MPVNTTAITFACLILTPLLALAQPKASIHHYSTKNGLSDNRVMCILKDHDGFMWIGTWTGINKFDGQHFTNYKAHPGDNSELQNNRIDQIVEAGNSMLWLRAYDKNVYRFDKNNGQFFLVPDLMNIRKQWKIVIEKITVLPSKKLMLNTKQQGIVILHAAASGHPSAQWFSTKAAGSALLPSDSINCAIEGTAATLWIATPRGLRGFIPQAKEDYKAISLPLQLKDQNIRAIFETVAFTWFGGANGQLYGLHKTTGKLVSVAASGGKINSMAVSKDSSQLYLATSAGEFISFSLQTLTVSSVSEFKGHALGSIYGDASGRLWMEPEQQGVILFEPAKKAFHEFIQPNYSNYLKDGREYQVFEDSRGIVWIDMKGCGFGYFDPATSTVQPFYNDPRTGPHYFSNMLTAHLYDPAGILWLGTDYGGLEKIIFQPEGFVHTKLDNNTLFRVENEVRAICADRKNRLWVATKSSHITVAGEDANLLFVNAPLPKSGAYAIIEDSRGNIWLGTKGEGLFKAEPIDSSGKKYNVRHFLADPKSTYAISSNQIYSLAEDKLGRIWAGTFGGGINLVDETGSEVRFHHHRNTFKMYPQESFNKVRHLNTDADGRLWIGTTEGLLVLDASDRNLLHTRITPYVKVQGQKESIGDNDVQYIYKDRDNVMWILTSSGGLNRATGTNPMQHLHFVNYSRKDGLPSDYLLSCVQDRNGFLWIATQYGLSRFDIPNKLFRNFDAADGLPELDFSEGACTVTKAGEIIFGTLNGLIRFDPAHIGRAPINAQIAFTKFEVNNEEVVPGTRDSPLEQGINNTSHITLAYDQNIVSIDFAMLDYRLEKNEHFAYRLIGFDSAWRGDEGLRRAGYTNLPPGNYNFQVKSTNTYTYSNSPLKSVSLTILPPWWKTWQAYIIYLILAGLLLAVIRKYLLTILKLRQRIIIEREMADLKLNFFTNVSHELRTPLTLILNPLEEISKQETLSRDGLIHLQFVRKNAQRMARFVNQLLDLRKAQSGKSTLRVSETDLISFVNLIAGYFTDLASQQQITIAVRPMAEPVCAWIDAEKMDMVVYNVLSNAVKFTPADKHISIHIGPVSSGDAVYIEIIDEGPGVPVQELDNIFGLYFEGSSAPGTPLKGTGIGLALAKELVELHHGHITARNHSPQGLCVRIELKAGRSHFTDDQIDLSVVYPDGKSYTGENNLEDTLPMETAPVLEGEPPPQLLLVEDNPDLRAFLKIQLRDLFQIETANDGQEGLRKALELLPDVVLTDVMMPVMNGITMLDKLKNNAATSHIPVVLLSARVSVESQVEALKYGADYYLPKPFQKELLIATLKNLVVQRQRLFRSLMKGATEADISPAAITITSQDELFLKKVIGIVEEKMADIQFTIDTVAELMNMSRSPFYKKLKSLSGFSPVEFVREIRLKRSLQYLDAGEHDITLISLEVGFNSSKYFSTCFKQRFGQTPSEYIKSVSPRPKPEL